MTVEGNFGEICKVNALCPLCLSNMVQEEKIGLRDWLYVQLWGSWIFYSILIGLKGCLTEAPLGFPVRAGSEQLPQFYSTLCSSAFLSFWGLYFVFYAWFQFGPIFKVPNSDKQKGEKIYPLVLFPTHSKIEGSQHSQEQTLVQLGAWRLVSIVTRQGEIIGSITTRITQTRSLVCFPLLWRLARLQNCQC